MKKELLFISLLLSLSFGTIKAQNPENGGFSVYQFQNTIAPFAFSATTLTAQDLPWSLAYAGSYGQQVSGSFGYNGIEQQIAIKGYLGNRFTMMAYAGLGFPKGDIVNSAQQIEVIRNFLGGKKSNGWRLGIGLGVNRDYSNVFSALSRVIASYEQPRWKLVGNVLFEKAFAKDRDDIDVITSLGFQYRVTAALYAGLEAVGEDLEGFWDEDEAEGGARIMVGPTVNLVPNNSRFSFSLSGGPVMYATRSDESNPEAIRELPFDNGLTIRARVIYKLSQKQ
ncbi:MAG: hypothetical protein JXR65_04815 [Bacteroidales bacterium]|nr:hypothetical protein [Bacteroidales bacterium]